jgi:hypothetical protein
MGSRALHLDDVWWHHRVEATHLIELAKTRA